MKTGLKKLTNQLIKTIGCAFFVSTGVINAQEISNSNWQYIQIDDKKQKWGDWDDPDWLRYFGLDAGDVDRNGNLDVISGRYVYHNPGGDMKAPWKRTVLDDNVDAIFFMDVDGDPYADIIAQALPNLYWYEAVNEEGTAYKRRKIGEVPATSHVNSQGFKKAQIIPGGKSEFLIAGNGDIYLVKVPETDAENTQWEVRLICKNTSDEGIGVGDIDNDGDMDIAAGRRPEGEEEPKILVWFENPGNETDLWKPTEIAHVNHPIDRVEVADINGDNKADVIFTEERYPGLEPDAHLWWYEQVNGATWKSHEVVEQYSMNNLDITDFDDDGDIDILTAEHKGEALEVQMWMNDGKGNFKKTVVDQGKENHLGTKLIDLDNDGDLDIIGAGWDQHNFMHVWRNDKIKSLKTGMIFKDYPWKPENVSDDGKFLRVGGKLDYAINEDHFPAELHKDGFIRLPQQIDLKNAIGAEVFIERVQSHEDTKDFKIQFNQGKAIAIPEPKSLPFPATDYMFHTNIRAAVPLSYLNEGAKNSFKLWVGKEQSWDWPQNLVYGMVLRVYYDTDKSLAFSTDKISEVKKKDHKDGEVMFSLETNRTDGIEKVAYVGFYEDVNYGGDGIYKKWQYDYKRSELTTPIGASKKASFSVSWDYSWLPVQNQAPKVVALVSDKNGYTYVSKPSEVKISPEQQVAVVKPFEQDPFWTTRNGEHIQKMMLPFSSNEIQEAKLYWRSWSPCYATGLAINEQKIPLDTEKLPCYDTFDHELSLTKEEISALKKGENEIATLKTPLHDGKMVHGMDVQWPGIMLKVKAKKGNEKKEYLVYEQDYEGKAHFIIKTPNVTYYYDKAGGGFSRIIDKEGNDWVSFKKEPWGTYPQAAASSFRGLPNLVFGSEVDGGAGHPGHDKCTSEMIGNNKIKTVSKSGNWAWEWTIEDNYAKLEILKTDGNPYWFLYEGTPGGKYNPSSSVYGTDVSGPISKNPDFYKGNLDLGNYQWAYFSNENAANTFFIAQSRKDDKADLMGYLGNSEEGVSSKDGMTVFGFGRDENTTALLEGKNSFIIGMLPFSVEDEKEHIKASEAILEVIEKNN
ncbi:FG-GAP repeat domain-containing protein [Galbibacter mesophilus]|uniref:FG-GAP repeat domain-containing protein n=1 Tax=Galbibacter mesophilus TaxID=379069 RepID=UPI00191F4DFA|nr:VCBS repeat-containing protein [Galbibacter mesophilus]MCM5664332.1 VCBS repeat-containing protein [Galbibacter mesophilus]